MFLLLYCHEETSEYRLMQNLSLPMWQLNEQLLIWKCGWKYNSTVLILKQKLIMIKLCSEHLVSFFSVISKLNAWLWVTHFIPLFVLWVTLRFRLASINVGYWLCYVEDTFVSVDESHSCIHLFSLVNRIYSWIQFSHEEACSKLLLF